MGNRSRAGDHRSAGLSGCRSDADRSSLFGWDADLAEVVAGAGATGGCHAVDPGQGEPPDVDPQTAPCHEQPPAPREGEDHRLDLTPCALIRGIGGTEVHGAWSPRACSSTDVIRRGALGATSTQIRWDRSVARRRAGRVRRAPCGSRCAPDPDRGGGRRRWSTSRRGPSPPVCGAGEHAHPASPTRWRAWKAVVASTAAISAQERPASRASRTTCTTRRSACSARSTASPPWPDQRPGDVAGSAPSPR